MLFSEAAIFMLPFAIVTAKLMSDDEKELIMVGKLNHRANRNFIRNRHFVVGTNYMPPYMFAKPDNVTGKLHNDSVNGFVHQIIMWMAQKYGFTFEYIESPDAAFGAFVNGSWNGLVGMAARGEIDIVATGLSITYPRSLVIDFTLPYSYDPISIMIPFPELEMTISGITKPFQTMVWVGVLSSLFIVSVIIWLMAEYETHIHGSGYIEGGFSTHFWFLFRVVINADEVIYFTLATRLIISTWCLVSVVLVNAYTSSLVSYITAPKFIPLINSIRELADSDSISFTGLKDTSIDSALFAATTGDLAKIGNSLRAHPENNLLSIDNIEDIVYYGRKAFGFSETYLKQLMYDDFLSTKQCRLFIIKEVLFPDQTAFGMQKNSRLSRTFSLELNWLRQTGMLNYWLNYFLPKPYRCSADLSSFRPRTTQKLTLDYLSGAFLLYGAGAAFAIFSFLMELITYRVSVAVSHM